MTRPLPPHRRASRGALASALAMIAALATPVGLRAQNCGDELHCGGEPGERWEEAWKEAKTPLPPLPEDGNLRAVDASRADTRYEYLVDRTSITRGADDVMRYVVVVISSSGVRNVFFEGIRCLTDEVKTYAYASGNAKFNRITTAQWKPVAINGVRAYQEYLAAVILCDANGYAWDAEKAVAALGRQYTAGGVRVESFCRDCDSDMDARRND